MPGTVTCYLVKDANFHTVPNIGHVDSIGYPLNAEGYTDAQFAARERSRSGEPQLLIKIEDSKETVVDRYEDGQVVP